MNGLLTQNVKIDRVANAAAAAQTAVTSSVIDMAGYDGVAFFALLGDVAATSVLTLTAKENTANSTTTPTPTAITGGASTFTAAASDADNKVLGVDVVRPTKRYVFAVLTRTTADAVVDGILAVRYRGKSLPISNSDLLALAQSIVG